MERMSDYKKEFDLACEKIVKLEKENKKLKEKKEIRALNDRDNLIQIEKLDKENKKLKSDLAYDRTMLDNVRAEYKSSQNVIKELKEELSKYKKQYEHSMGEDDELIYEEGLYD